MHFIRKKLSLQTVKMTVSFLRNIVGAGGVCYKKDIVHVKKGMFE